MDPRSPVPMLLAPGSTSHALSAPPSAPPPRRPAIDDNILAENCGYEIVDGQVFELAPAEEEHGTEHFQLPAVLGAHLAPAYKGTVDMLTRPEGASNYAPDVSILPRARDATTGGRQLEELVFEVRDTESRSHVTTKTRKLIERGVRRAFLIDVNDGSVWEWSRAADDWSRLADDAVLTDRCFAAPVPVRALVDEVLADEAVARALLDRGNPVLTRAQRDAEQRGRDEGRDEGRREGALAARREALRVLARVAGVTLTASDEARIDACDDDATLDRWIANGRSASTAEELLR